MFQKKIKSYFQLKNLLLHLFFTYWANNNNRWKEKRNYEWQKKKRQEAKYKNKKQLKFNGKSKELINKVVEMKKSRCKIMSVTWIRDICYR